MILLKCWKKKMHPDTQLWHNLLWVSGGKLELLKCRYHLDYFDFVTSGLPLMWHIEEDCITLKDDKDEDVQIKSNNIFTPHKNLGHYKAPDDNQTIQFEVIKNNAVKLTNDIVRCSCTRPEAKMLYESVWRKSLAVTLSQLFLNLKQLDNISKRALPWIYSKCRYNRNIKREILNGPAELSRDGFTSLETTEGSGYIIHLL